MLGYALVCGLVPLAHAGRPLVTDDAGIVADRACHIEAWWQDEPGGRAFWALPACNPGGNLEITLGGGRFEGGDGATSDSQVLQFKTLFQPLTDEGWGRGLALGRIQHVDDGEASRDAYAYLVASRALAGGDALLHLNLGWLRRGATDRHALTWGAALERRVSERLWLFAESFGENRGRAHYQMGARLWLALERVQIDATWGDQFGGGARVATLGLVWVSPPFLF